ncbi:hypothetical protein SLE2022_341180 [Rubroshorea leprosula]
MFLNIPNADALMVKDVLHNWGDKQCVKVLKNCYNALPSHGKLIIVNYVMPEGAEPKQLGQTCLPTRCHNVYSSRWKAENRKRVQGPVQGRWIF